MAAATDKLTGLTAEQVQELLNYDPETGEFTWKVRNKTRMCKGKRAGATNSCGYIFIRCNGRNYLAHRLAWLIMTGEWPPYHIDHVNGDQSDNRFSNLRLATWAENSRNSKLHKDNNSGVKGVTWSEVRGIWVARIWVNKHNLYLGSFTSLEDAASAYEQAAKKYFGEFARPERDTMPPDAPPVNLQELGIL